MCNATNKRSLLFILISIYINRKHISLTDKDFLKEICGFADVQTNKCNVNILWQCEVDFSVDWQLREERIQ